MPDVRAEVKRFNETAEFLEALTGVYRQTVAVEKGGIVVSSWFLWWARPYSQAVRLVADSGEVFTHYEVAVPLSFIPPDDARSTIVGRALQSKIDGVPWGVGVGIDSRPYRVTRLSVEVPDEWAEPVRAGMEDVKKRIYLHEPHQLFLMLDTARSKARY